MIKKIKHKLNSPSNKGNGAKDPAKLSTNTQNSSSSRVSNVYHNNTSEITLPNRNITTEKIPIPLNNNLEGNSSAFIFNGDYLTNLIPFVRSKDDALALLFTNTAIRKHLLKVHFKITLTLTELLDRNNEKLHFAQKNELIIKLKVKSPEECLKLSNFISQTGQQPILGRIEVLELGTISNNNDIQGLLKLITEKFDQFKNLKSFECGHIETTFMLPEEFKNIKSFKCGPICYKGKLKFPQSLNSLRSFECGRLLMDTSLILTESFENLTSFKCGDIATGARITLPQLNKLISFECGDIFSGATLSFPQKLLQELKYFQCGKIQGNPTITLPEGSILIFSNGTLIKNPSIIYLSYDYDSSVEDAS